MHTNIMKNQNQKQLKHQNQKRLKHQNQKRLKHHHPQRKKLFNYQDVQDKRDLYKKLLNYQL